MRAPAEGLIWAGHSSLLAYNNIPSHSENSPPHNMSNLMIFSNNEKFKKLVLLLMIFYYGSIDIVLYKKTQNLSQWPTQGRCGSVMSGVEIDHLAGLRRL